MAFVGEKAYANQAFVDDVLPRGPQMVLQSKPVNLSPNPRCAGRFLVLGHAYRPNAGHIPSSLPRPCPSSPVNARVGVVD